jgi:hypothetical protein
MGNGTTHLTKRARAIFDQLGYDISGDGTEFRAEREWKSVHVLATDDVPNTPDTGELRCFVTYRDVAEDLQGELLEDKPPYDWAIISVDGEDVATDGGYDVIHPPEDRMR